MPLVEIRDYVLWAKHVHDGETVKRAITDLPAGTLLEMEVDGIRGWWKRMEDGTDGRPTPGIKPVGKAKEHWSELQERRGELVSIEHQAHEL